MPSINDRLSQVSPDLHLTDVVKEVVKKDPYMSMAITATGRSIDDLDESTLYSTLAGASTIQSKYVDLTVQIATFLLSKSSFMNPLKNLFKGNIRVGTQIEEIYIELTKSKPYSPSPSAEEIFGDEPPKVQEMIYGNQTRKQYDVSYGITKFQDAFQSEEKLDSFLTQLVHNLVTSSEKEEFEDMLLQMQRAILSNEGKRIAVPVNADPATQYKLANVALETEISNLPFLNTSNGARVFTNTEKRNMILFMATGFKANLKTHLYSGAFNLSELELDVSQVETVPSLGFDEYGLPIQAIVVDKDKFLFYQKPPMLTVIENGKGLMQKVTRTVQYSLNTSVFKNMSYIVFGDAEPDDQMSFRDIQGTFTSGDKLELPITAGIGVDVAKALTDEKMYLGVLTGNATTAQDVALYTTNKADPTKSISVNYLNVTPDFANAKVNVAVQQITQGTELSQVIALFKPSDDGKDTIVAKFFVSMKG